MIRLAKISNNGEILVWCDTMDPAQCLMELLEAAEEWNKAFPHDEEFARAEIARNGLKVLLSVAGYKADVREARVVLAGDGGWPDLHQEDRQMIEVGTTTMQRKG